MVDQDRLRRWAERSNFARDFEGRVRGLGLAVYHWQSVESRAIVADDEAAVSSPQHESEAPR